MSADADSAFGRHQAQRLHSNKSENINSIHSLPQLPDRSSIAASRVDRLPFGSPLASRVNVRAAQIQRSDIHSLPQLPDNSSTAASRADRLPFGSPLTSTVNARAAQMRRPGWFERRTNSQTGVSSFPQQIQQYLSRTFSDQVTPVRLASHLSVLGVAALILLLSRIDMPNWSVPLRVFPNSSALDSYSVSGGASSRVAALVSDQSRAIISGSESLQRATVPFTIIHEDPKEEIQLYTVQSGDTVLGIAEKFGLQPETIQWANSSLEYNADLIRPGDQLNILPINGVLHSVTSGDTLSTLASKYRVSVEEILNYGPNQLADASAPLILGQQIVVPGGTKPYVTRQVVAFGPVPASAKIGTGAFVWPTSGSINQRYWGGHAAVDIGAWTGAAVRASDGGYVVLATGGWNGGYGNHVIIDHGNGFATLYAHLNSIYVRSGENVSRGQQVGSVGNTGNSTGPHLHFEIRYQSVPRNPLSYLP